MLEAPLVSDGRPQGLRKPSIIMLWTLLLLVAGLSLCLVSMPAQATLSDPSISLSARRLELQKQIHELNEELAFVEQQLARAPPTSEPFLDPELGKHSAFKVTGFVILLVSVNLLLMKCCGEEVAVHPTVPPPTTGTMNQKNIWEDHDQLARTITEELKTEKFADLRCFSLWLNRPWRTVPGPEVVGIQITDNEEWLDYQIFPNGVTDRDNMAKMVFGFWAFLWRKKRKDASWCVFLRVLQGVAVPCIAQLFGLIVGEMNPEGDVVKLFWYCSLTLLLHFINTRAHYVYEVDVPGASVRYELTARLQRMFFDLPEETRKSWPAGRCSAMLQFDVTQAVNLVWESIFTLSQAAATFVVSFLLVLHNYTSNGRLPAISCGLIVVVLHLAGYLGGELRKENVLDLAKRKRDWQLTWSALSYSQMGKTRKGIFDKDEKTQDFSNACMAYRKRAFHYFFIRLTASMVPSEIGFCAEALVAFLAAYQVINGNMEKGQAAALVAIMKTVTVQVTTLVDIHLDIVEGYASLLEIAQVFNSGKRWKHLKKMSSAHSIVKAIHRGLSSKRSSEGSDASASA